MRSDGDRVVSSAGRIESPLAAVFEFVADPSQHPRWDGNDNLSRAPSGQRITAAGQMFTMTLTRGSVRENHVVEFEERRVIAWMPAEPGKPPVGHLWRWQFVEDDAGSTLVTHTYDWTNLHDPQRLERARWTTSERLAASIKRLRELAERS
ncbi:MAG: SRPBCC family protein [Acidimicrobiales bacterium]